jgi:hypothetical protein
MTLALTSFSAVEQVTAAAVATYAHGVNFILLSVAALVFLFLKPRRLEASASVAGENQSDPVLGVDPGATRS